MTRVIGIFPYEQQVDAFINSMRNEGFESQDMIISLLKKTFQLGLNVGYVLVDTDLAFNEFDGYGLFVAIEVPKLKEDIVKEMMEFHGAREIKTEK